MAEKRGGEPVFPQKPDIGYRANNALIAHDDNIVKPKDSGEEFQYEGELVAVFGKKCRNVSQDKALDYVLGWTIGNDVSERGWQARRPHAVARQERRHLQADGSVDRHRRRSRRHARPRSASTAQVTETFKTNNMIFDAPTYISEVSKYCTIYPGDVMWMGTDGVPANMKVGDTVEIEITGIGTLRNFVVAEK